MTRLFKTSLLVGAAGMGLLALGTGAAHAAITPQFVSVAADGSLFRYTYQVNLSADQVINLSKNPAVFTIYDFAGFVSGTDKALKADDITVNPDWSFSSLNSGPIPAQELPVDSPALPNLTWSYTGAPIGPGQITLGYFSADSIYSAETLVNYAASATKHDPGKIDDLTYAHNGGTTVAPAAPEPCSMALLGFGVAPLLGGLRRRMRKA